MEPINLRSFKIMSGKNKRKMRVFLGKVEKNPPRHLDKVAEKIEAEVWQEVDCLTCANCCKSMTVEKTAVTPVRVLAIAAPTAVVVGATPLNW